MRLAVEPLYEPTFREASHGLRPGRSCQTAITAARPEERDFVGFRLVVDPETDEVDILFPPGNELVEGTFENAGSALELPPGAIGLWTPMNKSSFRGSFKCSSALSVAPVQLGVWGRWLPQRGVGLSPTTTNSVLSHRHCT